MPIDLFPLLSVLNRKKKPDETSMVRTPGFNPEAATGALDSPPLPAGPIEMESPYLMRRLPGGNPKALPDIKSRPMSLPPPTTAAIPGGNDVAMTAASLRPLPPPTRAQQVDEAKEAFMAGTPQGFGDRLKYTAINTLKGFGQGLATGGGIGAGVGGAIGQGAVTGIAPRITRGQEFEREVKPKIYERFAMEDQEVARRQAAQKALQEAQLNQARLGDLTSQTQSRQATDALNQKKFEAERNKPITVAPGASVYDPRARQSVFTAPIDKPMSLEEAEGIRVGQEGTTEEIAQSSLRGRIDSLKQQLTPDERRFIEGGATNEDDPKAITAAQAKWERIQQKELDSIRRDTGERTRARAGQIRRGGRSSGGRPGRTAISVQEAAELLKR